MNHTILIVDDEIEIALSLKDYLTEQKYNVLLAYNVDAALGLISAGHKIDLILSDIRMPDKTGLDLFQEYTEKVGIKNAVPFVLMTSHADIISVVNALQVGISDLISKPFDLDAICLITDYLLGSHRSYGPEKEPYFSVPIQDIILSKTSDYNIFLKIDNKYVRVTKTGQNFTSQRLDNFAFKGVTHVYLGINDFAKYTNLQFAIASMIGKRPMDEAKKIRIMNHLMSSISQSSIAIQIDKKYMDQSIQAFEAYTQVALNHSQLNNILSVISSKTPDLAEQSTLKAIIASSIAGLWKWNNPKVQSRIILAALFSDIGLKDCMHLTSKNRFDFTADEVKQYEQHPLVSYEMLKNIENIPEEILLVAIQHHENAVGLGFPQKLPRSKIHSYSKLIHGIGVFIDTVMLQDDKKNIKNSLDLIHRVEGKTVSEQVIKSLYLLFKIEMPQALESVLLPSDTSRVI